MSILENNIANISRYNPILAEKLMNYSFDQNVKFDLFHSASGDVNLNYNGINIHDSSNPQNEAITILNRLNDISLYSTTIVFGLGLGYLFKRIYIESKGNIVIYEPNLDILRFTTEAVDFNTELSDKRVYITSNRTELIKCLDEAYLHNSALNLCALTSYQNFYHEEISNLMKDLPKIQSHLESNYTCLFEKSYLWTYYGIQNIPKIINSYNVDSLRGKFKSKPAIIVSSGPSLDNNIETLAKYRDKAMIFSTGNAYKALDKYNIKPDFISFIEAIDNSSQLTGLDTSEINFIYMPIVNPNVMNLNTKRKFIFYSNNDLIARWLSKISDFSIEDYENKGNVSYCLLYSAYMMGCNPIILLGQDLAYSDGKCYASSSAYGGLVCRKDQNTGEYTIDIEDLDEFNKHYTWGRVKDYEEGKKLLINSFTKNLAFVKGQNGELLPTYINYAGFISFLEEFAYQKADKNLELINSSIGGAQINGFKNLPLQDVLSTITTSKGNIDEIIDNELSLYSEPNIKNIDNICKNLKILVEIINLLMNDAKIAQEKSRQLLLELGRLRPNVQKIRTLYDSLIQYYVKFKDQGFAKHEILSGYTFKEIIDLTRIFEQEDNSDGIEGIVEIAKKSEEFYKKFNSRSRVVKNYCENVLTQINLNNKDKVESV